MIGEHSAFANAFDGKPPVPMGVVPHAGERRVTLADYRKEHPVPAPYKDQPEGAVGDVNSTAKGSGARFNAGKAPLDLIPLRFIARSSGNPVGRVGGYAICCMRALALWQETGEEEALYLALAELGPDIWQEAAHVLDYGRKKYAEWNWAKGMQWSIPLACAARHLMAILEGEEVDPESGRQHRGHVACNIVMLLQFMRTYPEGDNRPRMLATA